MAGRGTAHLRPDGEAMLRVEHLVVEFPVGRTGLKVNAVSDLSLDILEGETVGLVGESGCGKSTTGRAIIQLPPPVSGSVKLDGIELTALHGEELRRMRPRMQMIFQDPISSLNPRRKIRDIVAEGLEIWANQPEGPRRRTTTAASIVLFVLAAIILLNSVSTFFVESGLAAVVVGVLGILLAGWPILSARSLLNRDPGSRLSSMLFFGVWGALALLAAITAESSPVRVFSGLQVLVSLAGLILLMSPATRADFPSRKEKATFASDVTAILETVGIDPANGERRPHEFSGGQCQRISIARALVTEPKLIICDEPVSALDVSVQAQIINLLADMKERYGLALVFIAHDLAVVKNVSDRVLVMYLGKFCELGVPDDMYASPAHPYTAALLAAIPEPDPEIRPDSDKVLGGELPSPMSPPSGCRFRTRCPKAQDICAEQEPEVREFRPKQFVACHFPIESGEALEFASVPHE